MSFARESSAVAAGVALVFVLSGCAGGAGAPSSSEELNQDRVTRQTSGDTSAADMQGHRLAEYAAAHAAAVEPSGDRPSAAEAQGDRLTEYAAARAAADRIAE
ncbi:hypothetical protein [Agromyces neolithicus]|uniref:Uncharacterized protein n=1 Tax=Agromyces neolithicus TaxID=269420 RepID=A0ABP4Y2A0_9MICO